MKNSPSRSVGGIISIEPVFEEQAVLGAVRAGGSHPGGGFGIRDGLPDGLFGGVVPFHIQPDPDHARVVAVLVQHQVDELFHRGLARLDLQPHGQPGLVEQGEGFFVLVAGRELDVWVCAGARKAEPRALACQAAHDPDGLRAGGGELASHALPDADPVLRAGVVGGAIG